MSVHPETEWLQSSQKKKTISERPLSELNRILGNSNLRVVYSVQVILINFTSKVNI